MRFNFPALLLAAFSGSSLAATTLNRAAASECGDLGVMEYDEAQLPRGMTSSDVRKCAKHPLGNSRVKGEGSLAPEDGTDDAATLQARECYYDAQYGCTDGYCWKSCGQPGQWCWAAQGDGTGPWVQCASYKDCGTQFACGKGCGEKCGCSC
ncbi:hypothetical protein F4805DRAFT_454683 [Annulohypoxylon moriforme]|nr:hypothetical protein F4805DRAFT_454683 [Annulohypoxylon moriforme]